MLSDYFCSDICGIIEEYLKPYITQKTLLLTLKACLHYPPTAFGFDDAEFLEWISKIRMIQYVIMRCCDCETNMLRWDDLEKKLEIKHCPITCSKHCVNVHFIRLNPLYNQVLYKVLLKN